MAFSTLAEESFRDIGALYDQTDMNLSHFTGVRIVLDNKSMVTFRHGKHRQWKEWETIIYVHFLPLAQEPEESKERKKDEFKTTLLVIYTDDDLDIVIMRTAMPKNSSVVQTCGSKAMSLSISSTLWCPGPEFTAGPSARL